MPPRPSCRLVDSIGVVNPLVGGIGQVVDGDVVEANDSILLPNPPNGDAYAGPWIAAAGAWSRRADWDEVAEISLDDSWEVDEGTEHANTVWSFEGPIPAVLNVNAITISKRSRRRVIESGTGIFIDGTTPPVASLDENGIVPGTYPPVPLDIDADGRVSGAWGNVMGQDYIEGIHVIHNLALPYTIRITPGKLWNPGLAALQTWDLMEVRTTAIGSNVLAAIYMGDVAGVPTTELANVNNVNNQPVVYEGTAQRKFSDNTRRLIGYVKCTNVDNDFYPFTYDEYSGLYRYDVLLTQIASSASNTTEVTADIGYASATPAFRMIPPNVDTVRLEVQGVPTSEDPSSPDIVFGHPEDGITLSASSYLVKLESSDTNFIQQEVDVPCDSQGRITYLHTGAGGMTIIDVKGYYFYR